MPDFSLTAEQESLRDLARKFARSEMAPHAAECDRTPRFPEEIYRKAHELGLMNLNVPAEHGGSGLGVFDQCLIVEELAHACGGMTTSVIANCLALEPILLGGTAEQKERFLNPFCAKYNLASFCLTEPSGGSDAGGLKTRARRDGDHYVLDGEKCFITNAPHAALYTVFATVDPALRTKGITAFAVEQLGDVTLVSIDVKVGDTVAAGKTFGTIESVKTLSDLFAPVAGKVVRINDALTAHPELVNEDCYGRAWMIALAPSDPNEVSSLLDANAYKSLVG